MPIPPPAESAVDPRLLEIVVCPDCRADLTPTGTELVCSGCGLHYPIRDGIPVLLVDEALPPSI